MAMERTKEMWTPRERWTPEQSRQKTVPKDTDALCDMCCGGGDVCCEYVGLSLLLDILCYIIYILSFYRSTYLALTIEDFSCHSRSICHCLV